MHNGWLVGQGLGGGNTRALGSKTFGEEVYGILEWPQNIKNICILREGPT